MHRFALAIAIGACKSSATEHPATTRDSAGVAIVEIRIPTPPDTRSWRVIDPPLVDIGTAEGAPEQQLHRVQGAVRLDDGTIVIANGGSGEVRWYSSDGLHLVTAGREGDGPGEFRSQTWIGLARGDSVYVWDSRLARLSVFDPDGRFARDVSPPLPPGTTWPTMHGALADGSVLLSRGPVWFSDSGVIGVQRPALSILVVSPAGVPADSLGPFRGRAAWLRPGSEQGSGIRQEVPFGPATLIAAVDSMIWVGDNATAEVRAYDAAGELRRIVRLQDRPRLPVRPEHIEAFREERLSTVPPIPEIREGMRALLEEVPSPDVMPAFRALLADAEGNLWMEEPRAPGDEQPVWIVLDRAGRFLGRVETPAGLTIDQIGADYLLGRAADDLDVEHVRLYRLAKPGG